MHLSNVLKVVLLAPLVALASAQTADQVLTSPDVAASKSYSLSTLQSYFSEPYLGGQLKGSLGGNPNLTIFAPTDTAFTSAIALANKLSFIPTLLGDNELASVKSQVVKVEINLKNVTVSGAGPVNVIDTIVASNGVIHFVDGVLIPPFNVSTILTNLNALNDPTLSFKQLAQALDSQNLTTTVNTASPITGCGWRSFAPTDSAFTTVADAFPSATLTKGLKSVLTYHVMGDQAVYQPSSSKAPCNLVQQELLLPPSRFTPPSAGATAAGVLGAVATAVLVLA
ncbi:hypothetical protein M427DRAFT_31253 [Gonapodya prolifera JEL478]|uniref:FAS1 domain-containing protein n=1 Tax=Gonapodya prolifera (strain JEL478) TaxID=1344416 RepID=A0A139AJ26_GONPJ|nr:hypothetical protein M427DRAFT_31253 [Gonapodya prolifera JEL478]|eukprot:KXS16554.1 hypothetical protein M427DRAFT_31253 [Gonapodya prolifera JEL478]